MYKYHIYDQCLSREEIEQKVASLKHRKYEPINTRRIASVRVDAANLTNLWKSVHSGDFYLNAIILYMAESEKCGFYNSGFRANEFRAVLSEYGYSGGVDDLCWLTDDLMAGGRKAKISTVEGMAHVFLLCIARELYIKDVFSEMSWAYAERTFDSLENSCPKPVLGLLRECVSHLGEVRWWWCEPVQEFVESLTAIFFFKHHRFPTNWEELYSITQSESRRLLYGYTVEDWSVPKLIKTDLKRYVTINFEFFNAYNSLIVDQNGLVQDFLEKSKSVILFINNFGLSSVLPTRGFEFVRSYLRHTPEETLEQASLVKKCRSSDGMV